MRFLTFTILLLAAAQQVPENKTTLSLAATDLGWLQLGQNGFNNLLPTEFRSPKRKLHFAWQQNTLAGYN